jgi:hypothetical protein
MATRVNYRTFLSGDATSGKMHITGFIKCKNLIVM